MNGPDDLGDVLTAWADVLEGGEAAAYAEDGDAMADLSVVLRAARRRIAELEGAIETFYLSYDAEKWPPMAATMRPDMEAIIDDLVDTLQTSLNAEGAGS